MSTIAAEIDRLRKQVSVITDCEFRPRDLPTAWNCLNGQSGANITDGTAGGLVGPGINKLTITTSVTDGNGEAFELFANAVDSSGTTVGWPAAGALTVRTAYVHYELP